MAVISYLYLSHKMPGITICLMLIASHAWDSQSEDQLAVIQCMQEKDARGSMFKMSSKF